MPCTATIIFLNTCIYYARVSLCLEMSCCMGLTAGVTSTSTRCCKGLFTMASSPVLNFFRYMVYNCWIPLNTKIEKNHRKAIKKPRSIPTESDMVSKMIKAYIHELKKPGAHDSRRIRDVRPWHSSFKDFIMLVNRCSLNILLLSIRRPIST